MKDRDRRALHKTFACANSAVSPGTIAATLQVARTGFSCGACPRCGAVVTGCEATRRAGLFFVLEERVRCWWHSDAAQTGAPDHRSIIVDVGMYPFPTLTRFGPLLGLIACVVLAGVLAALLLPLLPSMVHPIVSSVIVIAGFFFGAFAFNATWPRTSRTLEAVALRLYGAKRFDALVAHAQAVTEAASMSTSTSTVAVPVAVAVAVPVPVPVKDDAGVDNTHSA